MKIKINYTFFYWMIVASSSLTLQMSFPTYNLGLLIGILFIPIFLHDILLKFFKKRRF